MTAVLELEKVDVWRWHAPSRTRKHLLSGISWQVEAGEHWALLGPNGAGKSTLLRIAAARSYPSSGRAAILGGELGRARVPHLHAKIGYVESKLADRFPRTLTGLELVLTGTRGALVVIDEAVGDAERRRAGELLELLSASHVAERAFGDCSDGERMRLLLARALMAAPPLLLLDEPTAGLDLPGREFLLASIARLAGERPQLTSIVVVHHVEDIPPTTTHALLLRDGQIVSAGAVEDALTGETLSEAFGIPVVLDRLNSRWLATVEGHPAA